MASYASATKNMNSCHDNKKERKIEYRSRDATRSDESNEDTHVVDGDYELSENYTPDNVDDDFVIEDTYKIVSEYITHFGNKFEKDYPEYVEKSQLKIAKTFYQTLSKWNPIAFTNKMKKERRQEQIKNAADKAFADKVRENKLRMAAEEARLDAIVASLPTESKAGREERLKAEAAERNRLLEEAREKARKEDESRSFRYRKSNMSDSGRYFKLNKIDPKVKEAQKEEQIKKKKLEKKEEKKALEDAANGKFIPSNTGNVERDKLIDERLARERHIKEMIVKDQQEKLDEPYIDLTGIDDEIGKNDEDNEEDNEEEEIMKIAINIVKSWANNPAKKESLYDKKIETKVIKEDDSKEWTTIPSKKRNEPIILKMGAMSFRTEQYHKRVKERESIESRKYEVIPQTEDEVEREAALIKLKESKGSVSTKSRMCSTYGTKQTCRHGNECKFAHSIEELTPSECFFGNKCQFIVSTGRKCDHIHPQENKIAYCKRIGIKMPKKPVAKKQSHPIIETTSNNDQIIITIKLPSLTIWNKPPNILREYVNETPSITCEDIPTVEDKRSEALEKLKSAKDKISTKSQMCSSFGSKKACKHGSKCRFAHTIEELTPSSCFFGEQCQFIHSPDKKCMHIHGCEDKNEYCSRVGIKIISHSTQKNTSLKKYYPPPSPIIEELNDVEDKRSEALEKLKSAKDKITTKSQMCSSFETNHQCKHGSKCRFAHTIEELTPSSCFFGEQCQFINSSAKKCMHIHDCEDKNEYCNRVGIGSEHKNITICRSVGTGKPCYHGTKCRFLH